MKELYKDSVSVESEGGQDNAVSFEPFVGIAPRQYLEFFRMPDFPPRKYDDTGRVYPWSAETMKPRLRRFVASYLFIELRAERYLSEALAENWARISDYRSRRCRGFRDPETPTQKNIVEWLKERVSAEVDDAYPAWVLAATMPEKIEPARRPKKDRGAQKIKRCRTPPRARR